MSHVSNVVIVFTPGDGTVPLGEWCGNTRRKIAHLAINRMMRRRGYGSFSEVTQWGGNKWPIAIRMYCASVNYLDHDWMIRMIRRISRCISGNVQLFIQDVEIVGALLDMVFPDVC